MSIALIGLITMALGGFALFHSKQMSLTVMCCMGLLGAASAMALGPANVTPGHLTIGIFALAIFLRPGALRFASYGLTNGRAGIFLFALCLWALVSGFILPSIFAGQFSVFPMQAATRQILEVPLSASGANFNQAVYFISGGVVFFMVSSMARTHQVLRSAAIAIVVAASVNLVIILLDTVTFAMGQSQVLSFIRNAEYAQSYAHKVMGIKRVTGGFPEASAFSGVTVGLFAFNFRLWRGGVFPRYTGWIALFTLFALLFTFSSTAYVALFVYIAFAYAGVLAGFDRKNQRKSGSSINSKIFILIGPLMALAFAIIIAVNPSLLDPITQTFDSSVASKLQSHSGVERMSWNTSGLNAFSQTFGLGAGTGSARTSSFVVGVLANLGVIGALLFAGFFYQLFKPAQTENMPPESDSMVIVSAARAACFISLIADCLSATSIDLGIHFYVYAGLICASVFYRERQRIVFVDVQGAQPAR